MLPPCLDVDIDGDLSRTRTELEDEIDALRREMDARDAKRNARDERAGEKLEDAIEKTGEKLETLERREAAEAAEARTEEKKNKRSSSDDFASHLEAIHVAVRDEHAGGDEPSSHARLKVLGICCPSEVPLIHSILDKRAGVRSVKVIVPTKTVLVEHASKTATASQLVDALNAARLQASLSRSEARWKAETVVDVAATGWDDGLGPTPTTVPYEKRTLWSVVTSWHAKTFPSGSLPPWPTQVACLCLFLLPFSAASSEARGLRYVALLAVVVGLPPIARKAFGSLRNRVVDMNTLMSLSVVGACALGYFGEGAAVV